MPSVLSGWRIDGFTVAKRELIGSPKVDESIITGLALP